MAQVAATNQRSRRSMGDNLKSSVTMTSSASSFTLPPRIVKQVPDLGKMALSSTLRANTKNLNRVELQQLNCSFDVVRPEGSVNRLKSVVRQQAKSNGSDITLMYAIRQPACPSNREHALQLSEFAKNDRRLALVGTVKETGKADEEILKFYQDYFRNPIYKDEKWNVYKAIGNGKLSMKRALWGFFRSQKRYRQKGICHGKTCATEGFIQGGILIFDRDGELHFAMNEDFSELDEELLAAGVAEARRRFHQKRKASMSTSTTTTSTSEQEDLTTTSNSEISM